MIFPGQETALILSRRKRRPSARCSLVYCASTHPATAPARLRQHAIHDCASTHPNQKRSTVQHTIGFQIYKTPSRSEPECDPIFAYHMKSHRPSCVSHVLAVCGQNAELNARGDPRHRQPRLKMTCAILIRRTVAALSVAC